MCGKYFGDSWCPLYDVSMYVGNKFVRYAPRCREALLSVSRISINRFSSNFSFCYVPVDVGSNISMGLCISTDILGTCPDGGFTRTQDDVDTYDSSECNSYRESFPYCHYSLDVQDFEVVVE